jgi:hypothetical protein
MKNMVHILPRTAVLLIMLPLLFSAGCNRFHRKQQAGVVAELNGHALTAAEISALTAGLQPEDSARTAQQFIRQWATDILQYEKAAGYRSQKTEAMVEDYRRSLYLHEYEQRLVAHAMPKNVPDTVVQQFYDKHKERFVLNESIMKGILLIVPAGAPNQDKLRKWLSKTDDGNLENIEKYAYQYAAGYELFIDDWRTANQILTRLPIETDILQQQMKKETLIEVQDSLSAYWLQLTDRRMAGDLMPLEYAKADIIKIILTQREQSFLQEQRNALYEEALKHNKLIIYEKP